MPESQTEFKKDMKIAIVTQNDYVREITTEYDQFMIDSNWITRVFTSYETAKEWIKSK